MSDTGMSSRTSESAERDSALRSRTAFDLVGELVDRVTMLVRNEVNLARAEMSENVNRAMAAVGMLVAAIVFFLVALNVLAAAAVAAIAQTGIGAGWASLIVGGVILLIAIILMSKGKSDLSATSLAPTRTTKNVRRDVRTVKEHTNNG
ncbi:putative superfamily III holin-X [Palleronia aestuarii]|uniref:Putative superfamily III holin-X n=1 Tax=Palleronia aestuarii TaxID=568105 RepID=A0A2W7Q3K7_9RHOB|nr:phage holin family protein [Palleronia aestuarii]PZX16219.1 putative superfamily III holin-X [Palleronia aestuarii]